MNYLCKYILTAMFVAMALPALSHAGADRIGHVIFPDATDTYDRLTMPSLALEILKAGDNTIIIQGQLTPPEEQTSKAGPTATRLSGAKAIVAVADLKNRLVVLAKSKRFCGDGPKIVGSTVRADGASLFYNGTNQRQLDTFLPNSYGAADCYDFMLFRIEEPKLLNALKLIADSKANCSDSLTLHKFNNEEIKADCNWIESKRRTLVDAFRDGIGLVNLSKIKALDTYVSGLVSHGLNDGKAPVERVVKKISEEISSDNGRAEIKEWLEPLSLDSDVYVMTPKVRTWSMGTWNLPTIKGRLGQIIDDFDKKSLNAWYHKWDYGVGRGNCDALNAFVDVKSWQNETVWFGHGFSGTGCYQSLSKTKEGSKYMAGVRSLDAKPEWKARVAYENGLSRKTSDKCGMVTGILWLDGDVVSGFPRTRLVCTD